LIEEGVALSEKLWSEWPRDLNGVFIPGELVTLLASQRPLLKVPGVGFTVALKVVLWPAGTVRGSESPEGVEGAPDCVAWRIVTSRVLVMVLVLPIIMSPKWSFEGLARSAMDWAGDVTTGKNAIKSKIL